MEFIFRFLLLFITYSFLFLTIKQIANDKSKINYINLVSIIIVMTLNVLIFKITNGIIKGFITYLGFFIFSKIGLKNNFKESIVIGFIMYLYAIIGEIIASIVLILLNLDSFISESDNLGIYKLIFSSICAIMLYVMTFIPGVKVVFNKIKETINKFKYLSHLLIMVFFVFEISIVFLLINTSDKNETILSIILIIIVTLGVSTIIYSFAKNDELELVNDNLKEKNESFLKVLNNYKMFKHNMKHELNAISSIGNKKVKELVSEYIKEYENDYNLNIDDIIKMPDGIKGIMYQKIIENKDIPCNVSVDNQLKQDPFNNLNIKKLCKLYQCIGIIFDNAVEAAKERNDGFVYINLYEKSGGVYMDCSNNFNNELDINNLGKKITTSKKEHFGVGLKYLYNQDEFKISSRIRNDVYSITIKLC